MAVFFSGCRLCFVEMFFVAAGLVWLFPFRPLDFFDVWEKGGKGFDGLIAERLEKREGQRGEGRAASVLRVAAAGPQNVCQGRKQYPQSHT